MMFGRYSKYIKLVHILGDIAAISIAIGIAFALSHSSTTSFFYLTSTVFALISWFICTSLLGTYKIFRVSRRLKVIFTAVKAILLYIILIEASLNISGFEKISRPTLLYFYATFTALIFLWRVIVTTALRIYRAKGYNLRNVIIAGHNETAKELADFFEMHPEFGYRFLGFFRNKKLIKNNFRGSIADIEPFSKQNSVDEIYCCSNDLDKQEIVQLLNFADDNLIRVKFLPELNSYSHHKLKIDFYDVFPVLIVRALPLDDAINKFFKRAFDIAFSLTVIVLLLSWLLPVLAILIRLSSKGPILFKQLRTGIDNKSFECYKLRTMYVNNLSNSQLVSRGDSRITPIGAFLRKTSLDELPQFFNVLFGQMSIVGPRPHMLKADEEYAVVAEKYKVRHLVKPGITGLSQVRGYRGDTTHTYQVRGRVRLDIFYLENWSFYLDLKIIFYTVYNVIKGDKQAY